MGTGASNQVRSRPESETTKVEKLGSPNLSDNHIRFKPATTKASMLFASNRSVINSQSDIVTHVNHKPCKSQKSQLRSEPSPSYGLRPNVGTEATVDHVSTNELHQKIQELELALAISDSQRLDLQDKLQVLEERATADKKVATPTEIPATLFETLNAKDQHIKQLERELKYSQIDFQKKTSKLKKQIRALTKQMFELRHEALITQMELKTQPHDSADNQTSQTTSSSEIKETPVMGAESSIGHTKIIVELSSQISEQEEQIAELKAEVAEKNQRIEYLEVVVREMRKVTPVAPLDPISLYSRNSTKDIAHADRITSTVDEKHGSYFGHPTQKSYFQTADLISDYKKSHNVSLADSHLRSRFRHQTTSLSDSDSDWDEGLCLSKGDRHSAPARSRIKSHSKSDLSTQHTSSIRSKPDVNLQSGDNYLSSSIAVLNIDASNNLFEAKEQI